MNKHIDYIKIAVLKDSNNDFNYWIKAIEDSAININFDVIDIMKNDWLDNITKVKYDIILVRPPAFSFRLKKLYDERLYVLSEILGLNIYPTYKACLVYENKRMLSYLLKAKNIPHPETRVYYSKQEALEYINLINYPIVAKTIIGASGFGVKILSSRKDAQRYISKAFRKGVRPKTGPDFRKPKIAKRFLNAIMDKKHLKQRLNKYYTELKEKQSGFVYLQEYIPHSYEWRCVRIGISYFAHKKVVRNEMASGSLIKSYDHPPEKLLNFVKGVSEITGITSAAFDIFEVDNEEYLVNEIQTIFGQSDPHQMIIDGKPGRYIYSNGQWIFEQGEFNVNKSYNLRLEHAIESINLK